MGVSLITCLAVPQIPALLMNPFFAFFGQGSVGFRRHLLDVNVNAVTFGQMLPYSVAGTLGALSLWYASRLDFDDPKEDPLHLFLPAALAFFFCAVMIGLLPTIRPGLSDFLSVILIFFIGIPVFALLPVASFGLLLAGIIASPSAYNYVSARYDLKRKFSGAVGAAPSGMSDLQKRLLARQAPADHVVEDTERFRAENAISDLMIEVEMLRVEIEMLTQNRKGTQK
jgi:hypothetical protein